MAVRRKVFVSYHHDVDSTYYDRFVGLFSETYEIVRDNSVRQEIQSDDADYVIRRIRDLYLTGSSVTVVLCGRYTWGRRFVDWEILASLNQEMGLIGVNLPTNLKNENGKYPVPDRLYDNIVSNYALWRGWDSITSNPSSFARVVEASLNTSKSLIDNSRPKRQRNASTA